jgi:c-di-GMP-binding flagellar brake protein YcgR
MAALQSLSPSGLDDEVIVSDRRIRYFLRHLASHHTWLEVKLEGEASRYRSIVLDSDEKAGELLLDEIYPRTASNAAIDGQPIQIIADVELGRLQFSTKLINIQEERGLPVYRCTAPEQMRLYQRRKIHRIVLGFHTDIVVFVSTATSDHEVVGRVHDISVGGMCMDFDSEDPELIPFLNGHDEFHARVLFPNSVELSAEFSLAFSEHKDDLNVYRVGAKFAYAKPGQQADLVRFVMHCERDAVRRRRQLASGRPAGEVDSTASR